MKLRNSQSRREPRPKAVEAAVSQPEQPERRFNPETEITEDDWNAMKQTMESYRGLNWWHFLDMAMNLAILFPEKKAELGLDDQAWDAMKQQMESNRGSDWWSFSNMAMHLAVLFPERKSELGLDDAVWGK